MTLRWLSRPSSLQIFLPLLECIKVMRQHRCGWRGDLVCSMSVVEWKPDRRVMTFLEDCWRCFCCSDSGQCVFYGEPRIPVTMESSLCDMLKFCRFYHQTKAGHLWTISHWNKKTCVYVGSWREPQGPSVSLIRLCFCNTVRIWKVKMCSHSDITDKTMKICVASCCRDS